MKTTLKALIAASAMALLPVQVSTAVLVGTGLV